MNFTLDQLLALDAIERTGSFAEAATQLHKVPSAVSYSIQSLESALGVDVFDRSRRKAVLTPEGQRILDLAREVISQARELERSAAQMKGGWEPELHVVVDGALPMEPFLRCMRRFSDPEVPTALRLDVEYQEGVLERFERDPADLAMVIGLVDSERQDDYERTDLGPIDLVLVVASEHPLTQAEEIEEARHGFAELVVRDSSSRFVQQSRASFIGSKNVLFLSDFHSKRIALIRAAGYGWIPHHLVAEDLEKKRLVLLDVEPNRWTYRPQLVARAGRSSGKATQLFIETLAETLND